MTAIKYEQTGETPWGLFGWLSIITDYKEMSRYVANGN